MASETSMALEELVRKAQLSDDVDFLREGVQGVRALAQALMEVEVTQHVGAGRYERTPERAGERNGTRERRWDTRVGSIALRVPRVRDGSYFPSLLEPRRRAERALVAVVQEAYVQGVSPRRVDDLVQALGLSGISKSQVSLLCQELDTEVERFRTRPLGEACYPYLWLDATYVKARINGRVASQAVVIAIGLNAATGQREVLGLDVGPSEDGAFWVTFLRGLVARGLGGVQLVVSDAHEPMRDSKLPLRQCSQARAGNAAGSILSGTRSHWCRSLPSSWLPPPFHSDGLCAARGGDGAANLAPGRRGVSSTLPQVGCASGRGGE